MSSPDLTFAREQVERLMDDTFVAKRNPAGYGDSVMGPDGVLVNPPGQPTTVYTGPGRARPVSRTSVGSDTEGGWQYVSDPYVLVFPWDAPEFQAGDVFTCTNSERDPQMVGRVFIARGVKVKTLLVQRTVIAESLP